MHPTVDGKVSLRFIDINRLPTEVYWKLGLKIYDRIVSTIAANLVRVLLTNSDISLAGGPCLIEETGYSAAHSPLQIHPESFRKANSFRIIWITSKAKRFFFLRLSIYLR